MWLLSVLWMGVVGYIAKIILEFVFKQKL
ncbi:MAG: hypothetical protein EBR39_02510 [Betaproteobacteria bacterium]|nr:hypothetical protein [Betaproteobacteria bacterium]